MLQNQLGWKRTLGSQELQTIQEASGGYFRCGAFLIKPEKEHFMFFLLIVQCLISLEKFRSSKQFCRMLCMQVLMYWHWRNDPIIMWLTVDCCWSYTDYIDGLWSRICTWLKCRHRNWQICLGIRTTLKKYCKQKHMQ